MATAYPAPAGEPTRGTVTDPADLPGPDDGHFRDAQPIERASNYAKAVASIIGAVLVVLVAALADNTVTTVELINVGIALVSAVVVYLVPNLEAGWRRYAKLAAAAIAAGLQALAVAVLGDGVDLSAWLQVAIAVLTAAGVVILPNTDPWSEWVQDDQLGT
ncbi:hypothetical protein WDZ16_12860 [Pseudokineococcus marinus]|uniref:Uncharacterized protein n=1 Tax=Pseudokineococcus marinus TaxID=351215 RepID=A0A849BJU3_9ACTN|nr:hypothetical protein [Pseudokineococcus marinus]NNH21625.1 hypothetical protein [Pseudokineococcus marinus]